jgi:hypothetical protein
MSFYHKIDLKQTMLRIPRRRDESPSAGPFDRTTPEMRPSGWTRLSLSIGQARRVKRNDKRREVKSGKLDRASELIEQME